MARPEYMDRGGAVPHQERSRYRPVNSYRRARSPWSPSGDSDGGIPDDLVKKRCLEPVPLVDLHGAHHQDDVLVPNCSSERKQTVERELAMRILIQDTLFMFPNLHTEIYILPRVHFNRISYLEKQVGSDVIKLCQPFDRMSDVRFDECHRRIHNALSSMCERMTREVMTICFSLVFDNYLNFGGKTSTQWRKKKRSRGDREFATTESQRESPRVSRDGVVPSYGSRHQNGGQRNHTTARNLQSVQKEELCFPLLPSLSELDLSIFPRPRDLHQRGEFAILILHRRFGIIVGEIKSVGDAFYLNGEFESVHDQCNLIRRKVQMALKQLKKQAEILRYLLRDLLVTIPVTKVLVLPNLKRQMVHAALSQDPELVQYFCQTFDSKSLEKALQRCIFSEQLAPIGHSVSADDDVTKELLRDWWYPLTTTITPSRSMNDSLYESMVARFCGPATKQFVTTALTPRAEVSTMAQAVQETARCFHAPVLTQQQVDMLKEQSPRVYLSGPPGTGKTLMLMLKAKEWLRQGHTVMVVSLWTSSHAVSCYIDRQVKEEVTPKQAGRLLRVLNMKPNFEDVITELEKTRQRHWTTSAHCRLRETNLLTSSQDSGIGIGEFPLGDTVGDCEDGTEDDPVDSTLTLTDQNEEESYCCMDLDPTLQHAGESPLSELLTSHDRNGRCCSQIMERPTSGSQDPADPLHKLHVVVAEAPWFLDKLVLVLERVLGKDRFVIWVSTSSACPPLFRFTHFEVTHNLRRPPAVVREMMTTPAYQAFSRPRYSSQDAGVLSSMPYPTDGPRVKRIPHDSHGDGDVWNCEQCGEAVATFLTEELRIGQGTSEASLTAETSENTLCLSDVLISGHLPDMSDVIQCLQKSSKTQICFSPDSIVSSSTEPGLPTPGFLKGLEGKGVTCDVMNKDDVRSYRRLAFPRNAERVQVAEPELVKGVERKVVVVVGSEDFSATVPRYVDPYFDVMGCCTSQLVIVGDGEAERNLAKLLRKLAVH